MDQRYNIKNLKGKKGQKKKKKEKKTKKIIFIPPPPPKSRLVLGFNGYTYDRNLRREVLFFYLAVPK